MVAVQDTYALVLIPSGGKEGGVCVSLSLSLSRWFSVCMCLSPAQLPCLLTWAAPLCLLSSPTFSLSSHIHSSPWSSLWNFFLSPRTFSRLLSLPSEAPLARCPRRHLLCVIASLVPRTEQT